MSPIKARNEGEATGRTGGGIRGSGLGLGACCQLSAVSCQLQKDGRLQPAPIVAAPLCADEGQERGLTHKDVKNEECSSEFIENKGAKKVLLMS